MIDRIISNIFFLISLVFLSIQVCHAAYNIKITNKYNNFALITVTSVSDSCFPQLKANVPPGRDFSTTINDYYGCTFERAIVTADIRITPTREYIPIATCAESIRSSNNNRNIDAVISPSNFPKKCQLRNR